MTAQPNLFTRPDTFFGICQGLGEDLGIHPNLLRLVLAGVLFWSPYVALGAYAVGGAIVLASRLFAPVPHAAVDADGEITPPVLADRLAEPIEEPLPLAA